MFYRIPVDRDLQPFVHDIRVQVAEHSDAEPAPYLVLPGPYPVLGIRISGALGVVRRSGEERRGGVRTLASSGITGLQDGARWYVPQAGTRSILVACRPEGAFGLFGFAMDQLMNGELTLDELLPASDVRIAEERIAGAGDHLEAGAVASSLLRTAAAGSRAVIHPMVAAAVTAILTQRGNARIEALARASSVGRRQLERLFRPQVGMSPKRFAALARFAWAAGQLDASTSWSQLALGAGYADQAHFVRAVAQFSGRPPTVLREAAQRGIVSQSFNTQATAEHNLSR